MNSCWSHNPQILEDTGGRLLKETSRQHYIPEVFQGLHGGFLEEKVSHKNLLYYCFDTEKALFCPFAFKETEGADKILQPAKVKPLVPNTGIRYFTTSETKHMSPRKSICRKIILKDKLT